MIPVKQDQLRQKGKKQFKGKQYSLGIDEPTVSFFVKIMKIVAICFPCIEFMPKLSTVFYIFRNCQKLNNVRSSIPSKCYAKDTHRLTHRF